MVGAHRAAGDPVEHLALRLRAERILDDRGEDVRDAPDVRRVVVEGVRAVPVRAAGSCVASWTRSATLTVADCTAVGARGARAEDVREELPRGLRLDRGADREEAAAQMEVVLERSPLRGGEERDRTRVEEDHRAVALELLRGEPVIDLVRVLGQLDAELGVRVGLRPVILADRLDRVDTGLVESARLAARRHDQDLVVRWLRGLRIVNCRRRRRQRQRHDSEHQEPGRRPPSTASARTIDRCIAPSPHHVAPLPGCTHQLRSARLPDQPDATGPRAAMRPRARTSTTESPYRRPLVPITTPQSPGTSAEGHVPSSAASNYSRSLSATTRQGHATPGLGTAADLSIPAQLIDFSRPAHMCSRSTNFWTLPSTSWEARPGTRPRPGP